MIRALVICVVLGGVATAPAFAQSDFLSSSPGPLSKEHGGLDTQTNCNDCHTGGKNLSNDKCLGCHDHANLRARISAGEGYHASSKVKGRSCQTCHVEHKGRSFNIMGWRTVKGGEDGFDHSQTGWPLQEKHAVLDCSKCHKKSNGAGRRTFLGVSEICGACHERDQPHKFDRKGMMRCERCHGETSWRPPKSRLSFDHNSKSDAEFPQEGAHKDVSCGKCHPHAEFNLRKKNPGDCRGCHRTSHDGHMFDKKTCAWCHSPTRAFKEFRFDHKARTRFSLDGAHGKLTCYKCHTKSKGFELPNRACATCHGNENPHRDRFSAFGSPPRCETCHPETSWRPDRFSHGKTGFKLTGKHARIACRKCHRGKSASDFERFSDIPGGQACMSCHRHKNVHNNAFSDIKKASERPKDKNGQPVQHCLECHKMAGTIDMTKHGVEQIHGPRGRWPLTGEHVDVKCVLCHKDNEFIDTPAECGVRCHEDSLHNGTLGDLCSKCHQPGTWEAVKFDHDDDTKWPLLGLHKTVPKCEACHPDRKFAKTPMNCSADACHGRDDAHKGKLGKRCESCHLETGENIFNHNEQADYRLDGAHLKTPCEGCHPKITFKPRPKTCFGEGACHMEPDVHKGQYGTICESCHTTVSFKSIKPLHDVGEFALKGSHDRLQCKRCHIDSRPLAGSGNFCINCHRQDDIHSNSLTPRCGTCHTQWSFAPARFDHSTVGCNLTGLHRTLPCYDCHKSGNFGGLSPNCYGCHADSGLKVKILTHVNLTQCGLCHNPNFWVPAQGPGNKYGRESVCR